MRRRGLRLALLVAAIVAAAPALAITVIEGSKIVGYGVVAPTTGSVDAFKIVGYAVVQGVPSTSKINAYAVVKPCTVNCPAAGFFHSFP